MYRISSSKTCLIVPLLKTQKDDLNAGALKVLSKEKFNVTLKFK